MSNSNTKYIFNQTGDSFKISMKNGILKIGLKLHSEKAARDIGSVRLDNKTLMVKRDKSKHLFKKNESYGFNEYLIRNGKTFEQIMLTDDDGVYLFPKELILEKGEYLHFKQEGFERQLFLPLSLIKQHQIHPII